jgi:hypothetical protein
MFVATKSLQKRRVRMAYVSKEQRFQDFKTNHSLYLKRRRAILKGPEEELLALAKELDIHKLREKVEKDVKGLIKQGWSLYEKIYNERPDLEEVDEFIEIATSVMSYEDFITADQLKIWDISRNLVSAYRQSLLK